DLVDQQHRIAMRKRFQDGIDIHQFELDRRLRHSLASPFGLPEADADPDPWPGAPSRTSRSTATISRNHCRVGLAKKPPQRPRAGTSSLTPLMAVICAPSP